MDGPQTGFQGFAGFEEIPGKDSDETMPWPAEEVEWEGPMTATPPSADPAAAPAPPSGTYTAGFDDVISRGLQEFFIPLYSVRFRAEDIWGEEFAEPNTVIYGDQFEPYIKKES